MATESNTMEPHQHGEDDSLAKGAYASIGLSVEEDEKGILWVHAESGEYSYQVRFCPICGYKAKDVVTLIDTNK
jgi:hypothetical protein